MNARYRLWRKNDLYFRGEQLLFWRPYSFWRRVWAALLRRPRGEWIVPGRKSEAELLEAFFQAWLKLREEPGPEKAASLRGIADKLQAMETE